MQKIRSSGRSKPPDQNKTGGQILLCDDGRRAGKKKGTLEDELLQNGKTNTSEVVERGTPQAKHASLSYEVVEQDGKHAVLRIKLDTGRHHQIRVQLAHAGMPIVGDKKYNFKENIAPSGGQLALCSFKIAFRHPKTHRKLEFEIDKSFWFIIK